MLPYPWNRRFSLSSVFHSREYDPSQSVSESKWRRRASMIIEVARNGEWVQYKGPTRAGFVLSDSLKLYLVQVKAETT